MPSMLTVFNNKRTGTMSIIFFSLKLQFYILSGEYTESFISFCISLFICYGKHNNLGVPQMPVCYGLDPQVLC